MPRVACPVVRSCGCGLPKRAAQTTCKAYHCSEPSAMRSTTRMLRLLLAPAARSEAVLAAAASSQPQRMQPLLSSCALASLVLRPAGELGAPSWRGLASDATAEARAAVGGSDNARPTRLVHGTAPESVQAGDVLDAVVVEVQDNGIWVDAGPAQSRCFLPRRLTSRAKVATPLSQLFVAGEAIKVLVTGRSHQGRLYVSLRNFEAKTQPGSIFQDKQAVFARAEQAAAEFRQQGQQRAEARRELIASIKEGDGPLEAEVLALLSRQKVLLKIKGQLFTSILKPNRVPKDVAVPGKTIQVWCARKGEQGTPFFATTPPADATAPAAPADAAEPAPAEPAAAAEPAPAAAAEPAPAAAAPTEPASPASREPSQA